MKKRELKLGTQCRAMDINGIDEDKRELSLSFSSETPVRKWWGVEILDHNAASVDLSRFNSESAPFLVNHDRGQHIGIVVSAAIDANQKRGNATVRVGNSPLANEIWQDIKDGIRKTISFGYNVYKAVLQEESDDGPDVYRITKWEPLEISLESIPADYSVGLGRNEGEEKINVEIIDKRQKKMEHENTQTTPTTVTAPNAAPPVDTAALQREAEQRATKRFTEIMKIGAEFNMVDEAQKAIQAGASVEQFRVQVLETLKDKKHIDTQQATLDLPKKDARDYSLQKMIQAVVANDYRHVGLELEVSKELEKRFGRSPRGNFFVPHEVLVRPENLRAVLGHQKRDVTSGAGSGGSLIATDHMPQNFIELLQANAIVTQLGALVLSGLQGNISIPKQTGAATVAWVAEGAAPAESQPTFGSLALSPKFISGYVDYTRQVLLQSNPSIEALVIMDLLKQVTLGVDNKAIAGDGTSNTPTGIINTSGVGAVAGASLDWAKVVEFETDVAEANADGGSMAYLTRPSVRGILKTREKATNTARFLMENGEMNGYPVSASTQVPAAHMIFGAFAQLILAFWGALDIMINPYIGGNEGNVRVHVYQAADVGVRQAAAFSVSTDIT